MWFISKTWLLWSSVANACSLTWTWGDEHCGSSFWCHTVYKTPSYLPPNLLPSHSWGHSYSFQWEKKKKALAPAPPTFSLLLSGYSPTLLMNALTCSLQCDLISAAFSRRSTSNHYRKQLPISHCWCNIFIHSSSKHQFQAHWPAHKSLDILPLF